MPVSTETKRVGGKTMWNTISTLSLKTSSNDHGKTLWCTAKFSQGQTQQARITMYVKSKCSSHPSCLDKTIFSSSFLLAQHYIESFTFWSTRKIFSG